MTQRCGLRAFVAALFAWHPLHVESVAWVSERKDVLSALFFMLTILAIFFTLESVKVRATLPTGPFASAGRLLLLSCFFCWACVETDGRDPPVRPSSDGFLAFQRISLNSQGMIHPSIIVLLREKLPFFALALGASVVTYLSPEAGGSVSLLRGDTNLPRLTNRCWGYVAYVSNTFWPADFSAVYRFSSPSPCWGLWPSAVFLLAISACFLMRGSRQAPFYWSAGSGSWARLCQ